MLVDGTSCAYVRMHLPPIVILLPFSNIFLEFQCAAPSRLQVLYFPRDYRSEGTSSSESKEVTVRSSTEIIFQPENPPKVRKFKLSSVVSMLLSA